MAAFIIFIIRKEKIAAIPRFIFMIFSFEINESLSLFY